MFIEERHKKILEMLQKNKSITNQEIQDMFGISYDSAKRDLRLLEEQGMLKRTHGGAILRETIGAQYNIGDLTAKERIAKVDPNYLAIAKKAVTCINDNDVTLKLYKNGTEDNLLKDLTEYEVKDLKLEKNTKQDDVYTLIIKANKTIEKKQSIKIQIVSQQIDK